MLLLERIGAWLFRFNKMVPSLDSLSAEHLKLPCILSDRMGKLCVTHTPYSFLSPPIAREQAPVFQVLQSCYLPQVV